MPTGGGGGTCVVPTLGPRSWRLGDSTVAHGVSETKWAGVLGSLHRDVQPRHCATHELGKTLQNSEGELTVPTTNVPVRNTPSCPNEAFSRPFALQNKQDAQISQLQRVRGRTHNSQPVGTQDALQSGKATFTLPLKAFCSELKRAS